jgi:hypothetical protein
MIISLEMREMIYFKAAMDPIIWMAAPAQTLRITV